MKKLSFLFNLINYSRVLTYAIIALLVIFSQSCQSVENEYPMDENIGYFKNNNLAYDPLVESLTNLNSYIIERNKASNGELIKYMKLNPNYSLKKLEQLGFVNASYLLGEMQTIKKEMISRDEQEIVDIVKSTMNPEFTDFGGDGYQGPLWITIFKCEGCFDGDGQHCITLLFWSWGNGC